MQRVLVTGAAGFLGFCVAQALASRPDTDVVCIDNFVRGANDPEYRDLVSRANVTGLELDLNDQSAVASLPEDIDVIYHMAALNGTQNFYERPFDVVRCCTLPTIFLMERYGPLKRLKRFIYAGTSEAYASTVSRFGWEVPTGEDVPLSIDNIHNPRWSYAASKLHGEIAVVNASSHFGSAFTIVRYHNAYGPRMGDKHVIPDFLTRAKAGIFELYGHEDTRSFIFGEDAARATLALADAPAAAGEVVNVGGQDEITIGELAKMMMEVCGFEGKIEMHPSPLGSVKRRAPKVNKLKDLTGFSEHIGLSDGLRLTADYYLK